MNEIKLLSDELGSIIEANTEWLIDVGVVDDEAFTGDALFAIESLSEINGAYTLYKNICKQYNNVNIPVDDTRIYVRYHNDNLERIKKLDIGDWIDLRAAENVTLKAGEYKAIPLGVSMKLPNEYEAHIVPRSSTFKKWGILQTNHMGVIDNSYCGNNDQWHMPVYATRDTEIHLNDRICQFRVVKNQPDFDIIEVNELPDKNRGGFGSTGTN